MTVRLILQCSTVKTLTPVLTHPPGPRLVNRNEYQQRYIMYTNLLTHEYRGTQRLSLSKNVYFISNYSNEHIIRNMSRIFPSDSLFQNVCFIQESLRLCTKTCHDLERVSPFTR